MALVGHMEAGQGPRRHAPHRPAPGASPPAETLVPKYKRVREKQGRREDEALSFWPLTRSRRAGSLPFLSPAAGPAGSLARPAPRGPALAAGAPVPPGRRPHDDPTAARADPRLPPGARGPTLLCSAGVVLGKPEDPELRVSTSATTTSRPLRTAKSGLLGRLRESSPEVGFSVSCYPTHLCLKMGLKVSLNRPRRQTLAV